MISRIEDAHPVALLEKGDYAEFCLLLEGVSHFLCLIWNADRQRQVSLFDMELQAEVDKFVVLQHLFEEADVDVQQLGNWLFESASYDQALSHDELHRYERANHFAAKYCLELQQNYKLSGLNQGLLNELRRFYRYSSNEKLRYINKLN